MRLLEDALWLHPSACILTPVQTAAGWLVAALRPRSNRPSLFGATSGPKTGGADTGFARHQLPREEAPLEEISIPRGT